MSEQVEFDNSKDGIVRFIKEKLFSNAKAWKFYYSGDKHSNWIDDIKWYKGQQWKGNRPKDKSSVFFNRIFSTIQKELPFMTDRPPKIYVTAQEPSDKTAAEIFQKIISQKWVDRDMERRLPEGVMYTKQVGIGYFRCFWNKDLENGLGDIDCEAIDPFEIFPFPYSKDLENSEGMIWAREVSLGWVRANYPDEGWRVKPDKEIEIPDRAKLTNGGSDGYSQVSDTTGAQTDYLPTPSGGSMDESNLKRVLVITCVLKDGTMENNEEEGKKIKSKKLKYPNGREVTIAGGIILEDRPFPFENFPGFVEMVNYINPGEFFGISDIAQIKEGQKEFNKINAMVIDAIKRGIYTTKILNSQSGIDADNFVVSSDAIYDSRIANPIQEINNQQLPPQVFTYADVIERAIEKTAGVGEFTAPKSGDLPSGRALAEYQEITQTRLRQKIRNMEYAVRKIGKMWLELMLKNYTEQRVMRLLNSQTNESEYVFIFREDNSEIAKQIKLKVSAEIIEGTEQKDPNTGRPMPGTGQPKYKHVLNMADIKGGMDLMVATGSTVSTSQIATFSQAIELFKLGVIDAQALLDAADYPNKEEIMKRMQERAQQSQQNDPETMKEQLRAQTEQGKNQKDMQVAQMNNKTKVDIEKMKQQMNGLQMLEKLMGEGVVQ